MMMDVDCDDDDDDNNTNQFKPIFNKPLQWYLWSQLTEHRMNTFPNIVLDDLELL